MNLPFSCSARPIIYLSKRSRGGTYPPFINQSRSLHRTSSLASGKRSSGTLTTLSNWGAPGLVNRTQPLRTTPVSPVFQQHRFASRFGEKNPGSSRAFRRGVTERQTEAHKREQSPKQGAHSYEQPNSVEWDANQVTFSTNAKESLLKILQNDVLVVTRQIEMMNIFFGFEQANRYAIRNENGDAVGYIAEEQRTFMSMVSRQVFRTHRSFRAVIMDDNGTPILWLRRPFSWINSRMFVQRLKNCEEDTMRDDPLLETFSEVQQRWHLWRRRYDLFLEDTPKPIVSRLSGGQPEPDLDEQFRQFARVDNGFLAWTFNLRDARGEEIARISREFRGIGRELFTDTGQYAIQFAPRPGDGLDVIDAEKQSVIRNLTMDERASVLALSVNIDFDYFSRHSESGHWRFPLWGLGDD